MKSITFTFGGVTYILHEDCEFWWVCRADGVRCTVREWDRPGFQRAAAKAVCDALDIAYDDEKGKNPQP